MVPSVAFSRKRKQPPTFQHLPAERAKKLKRDWVEKKKIKSKWRHEKKKDGLGQRSPFPMKYFGPHEPTGVQETQGSDAVKSSANSEHASDSTQSSTRSSPPKVKKISHETHRLPSGSLSQASAVPFEANPDLPEDQGAASNNRGRSRVAVSKSRGRIGTIRAKGARPNLRAKMGALLEKIQKTHPNPR